MVVRLVLLYEQICKAAERRAKPLSLNILMRCAAICIAGCITNSHQHVRLVYLYQLHFSRDLASCSFAVAKKDCIFTYSNMASCCCTIDSSPDLYAVALHRHHQTYLAYTVCQRYIRLGTSH